MVFCKRIFGSLYAPLWSNLLPLSSWQKLLAIHAKVMDNTGFENAFLVGHRHLWHGHQGFKMRPAFFIAANELIIIELAKQGADGNVHQILLLFFGEFFSFGCLSVFIYTNQEKDAFHVWNLAETLCHQGFYRWPAT